MTPVVDASPKNIRPPLDGDPAHERTWEKPARKELAMWRQIATLVAGLVLVVVAIGIVFFVGMRTRFPLVLNAARRFNRAFGNPHQMKTAGTPGAYASVIRHVGRTTGRSYETPVVAFATDDGFVIALPYGSDTDRLKDVLASGSATIVDEGNTWLIDLPELVPAAVAAPHMRAREQRGLRRSPSISASGFAAWNRRRPQSSGGSNEGDRPRHVRLTGCPGTPGDRATGDQGWRRAGRWRDLGLRSLPQLFLPTARITSRKSFSGSANRSANAALTRSWNAGQPESPSISFTKRPVAQISCPAR
jgi:hypothetical protein